MLIADRRLAWDIQLYLQRAVRISEGRINYPQSVGNVKFIAFPSIKITTKTKSLPILYKQIRRKFSLKQV